MRRALVLLPVAMLLGACDGQPVAAETLNPADDCLSNLAENPFPSAQDVDVEALLRFEDADTSADAWLEARGQAVKAYVGHVGGDLEGSLETFKRTAYAELPVIFRSHGIEMAQIGLGAMPFSDVRSSVCPLLVDGITLETINLKPRVQTPESN